MDEETLQWLYPELYGDEPQSENMIIQDFKSEITDRPVDLELEFASLMQ